MDIRHHSWFDYWLKLALVINNHNVHVIAESKCGTAVMHLQTSWKRQCSIWFFPPDFCSVEGNTIKFSVLPSSSFYSRRHAISFDRRQWRRLTSIVPLSARAAGDGLIGLKNQTAAGTTVGKAAWGRGGKCVSHRVSRRVLEKIVRSSQSERLILSLS